jgi:hypothetical protein
MLVLQIPFAADLESHNCIVLDVPTGERVRVWLTPTSPTSPTSRNGARVVIDAPESVVITRGKLLGAAEGPLPLGEK